MTPLIDDRLAVFESTPLTAGAHTSLTDGACALEMASYLAGEPWSDHPACVSPVLGAFLRQWNDDLDDAGRQRLKPYIRRVLDTDGDPDADEHRAWLASDWLVRVQTPAWLDLAGLTEPAQSLRALPSLDSSVAARAAQTTINHARDRAAAAGDAARAAAAGAAAWDAAWAAARAAAGAAAWAAGAAAGDAAWDAGAAAWDAAGAAAGATAYETAAAKLAPTTASLQASAFALLDRLIAVGRR